MIWLQLLLGLGSFGLALAMIAWLAGRYGAKAAKLDAAEKGLSHAEEANKVRADVARMSDSDVLAELRRRGGL